MWLRIVCARRSASTSALTVSPTREPAVERAAVDDQAADRLLGVLDREQLGAAARLADDAAIADLAAALGVERRPIEDDLGRAVRRSAPRTRSRRAGSRRPGPRPSSSRSRGTPCRRRGPGSTRTAPSRSAWLAQLGLRAGAAALALLGERRRRSPPGRRATPYSAASSTVRSIGKPYVSCRRNATVAGEDRAHRPGGPPRAGRRRARRWSAGSAPPRAGRVPASSVRANWASSRAIAAEDLVAPLAQVRVGVGHDVDDDLRRSARNGSVRPSSRPWRTARRRIRRRT